MNMLKIFKFTGVVVLSWAVFLIAQNGTDNNNEEQSIRETSSIQNSTKKIPLTSDIEIVEKTAEEVSIPCDSIQKKPDFICDEHVMSRLNSSLENDSLDGLQLVWRFYKDYKENSVIKNQVRPLIKSDDFRIAKLSQFILKNMDDDPLPNQITSTRQLDNVEVENYQSLTNSNINASLLDEEQVYDENEIEKIMSSDSTFIRLKAVEIAVMQANDHAISLLSQAVKDSDDGVRELAVTGLGMFLAQGKADPEDVLNALEDNKFDSNVEIAELTNGIFERYQQ